jgi:MBG domain (YGX type)/Domain of unknown function (DUF4214)
MVSKLPSRRASHHSLRGVTKSMRRFHPSLESIEERLLLSTFTVNALTDTGSGSGTTGDLRYAITQANLNPGSTINITATGEDQLASELPALSANMTITDSTPGSFTLEGGGPTTNYRALTINSGVTASISGVNFDGFDTTTDGAILDVEGTLTLDNSQLFSSSTTGNGGGVLVNGTLTAEGCVFEFLSGGSECLGGAIVNNGTLNVIGGGFGNCSGEDGGAIGSLGASSLDVNGSLFIDNTASFVGGAIYCYGSTITDSTITGNSASNNGGGIYLNAGTLTLTNDTIASNTTPSGSAGAGVLLGLATVLLNNTIVAQNTAGSVEADIGTVGGPGLNGSIDSSSSHNLIGNTTVSGISDGSSGNMIGTSGSPMNAMLNGPALNGASVVSLSLQTGSPAIGAGLVADAVDPTTGDPLQFDQRGMGFPRVVNNSVDIGSFQTQSTAVASTLTVSAATGTYGGTTTLSAHLTSGGSNVGGELVDFHLGSIDLGEATSDNVTGIAQISNVSLTAFDAGTFTGDITASFAGDSNFASSNGSADLVVNPASLTITANNQTKVYGDALPTLTASYTGFVNGDTSASLTTAPTITTTATPASHVSGNPYSITASAAVDSNYTISYVAGTLSVTTAPLTITADNQTKVYGAALPTLTASYTGFVNGDTSASLTTAPTIVTTATAASHVPGSPYSITASSAVDTDYTISYVAGSLSVTTAPLTITANNQTKVYGAALPTLTASYTGFVNGDTSASLATPPTLVSTATAASHVAGSPYAITASGAIDADYTISYVAGNLSVTTAPLTITANSFTIAFGQNNPTLTASYSGFVNGDTSASLTTPVSLSTVPSMTIPGVYNIFATGAADPDYSITENLGELTITQAQLTITVNSLSKVYGAALPTLTVSYAGFINGDTPADLSTLPTITTTATAVSDVSGSPYSITASGAVDPNYLIVYVAGNLTVTPAPLTIAAANSTKVYGQLVPTLTGTVTGVLNGDNVTAQYGTTATSSSNVVPGGFPITVTGLLGTKAGDYSIQNSTAGTLTVTPAPLTVGGTILAKVYGQANPTFGTYYTGFVLGQNPSVLSGTLGFSTIASSSAHVGDYLVTPSGLTSSNYAISFVNGGLAVTPASLVVTAPSLFKSYGQAVPTLTPTFSGFVNGDTAASLATPVNFATSLNASSSVGFYPIIPQGASSYDYSITNNFGIADVIPALLVATPSSGFTVAGQPLPTFTVSYSGFVNGDTAASVTTPATITTPATSSSTPGFYPVLASGAQAANYNIVYGFGILDVLPPPAPPLNPGQVDFVTSLYENILGRTPEDGADAFWINELNQGVTRASVAQQIYFSPEAIAFRAHHPGQTISLAAALAAAQQAQLQASHA